MFDKLEQLRQKPDRVKHLIAFGVAFSITTVIFVFWFVSFTVSTQAILAQSQGDDVLGAPSISPFGALKANIIEAFVPVGNSFNNMMAYFSGSATSSVATIPSATSSATTSENVLLK